MYTREWYADSLTAGFPSSLSRWERVRVRSFVPDPRGPFGATVWAQGVQRPSPPALSRGEREL